MKTAAIETSATPTGSTRLAARYPEGYLNFEKASDGKFRASPDYPSIFYKGDGRALWIGQHAATQADGSRLMLDIVAKGIGRTPLAQQGPHHSDGIMTVHEAIKAMALSSANGANGIESTVDLAVLEVPRVNAEGHTVMAGISVRAGVQTRLAHLIYHAPNPENFRKMAEYLIRRQYQTPNNQFLTSADALRFVRDFSAMTGRNAARFEDKRFYHGSLTNDNVSSHGGALDYGTSAYLQGYHRSLRYLNFGKGIPGGAKLEHQTELMEGYVEKLVEMFAKVFPEAGFQDHGARHSEMIGIFRSEFSLESSNLWLRRLGLNAEQITKLTP